MKILKKVINYKIIQASKLIIETYVGDILVEDIINLKKNTIEDENYDSTFGVILDFRDASLQIDNTDLHKLYQFLKENPIFHKEKKAAYLTAKPNELVLTTVFSFKIGDIPIQPRIFSTTEAVVSWFGFTDIDQFKLDSMIEEIKTQPNKGYKQ